MELSDLFGNSPPPSPSRQRSPSRSRSRSRSPGTPLAEHRSGNRNGESLFLSPGIDSPVRTSRARPRSTSPSYNAIAGTASNGHPRQKQNTVNANPRGGFELDFQDPFAALNANGNDNGNVEDEDGEGGKKRKRVFAKIDADRLTSDKGFPALCRLAKKFKMKGKGHETKDLNNLLDMYQMWAHGMFPKGDFRHTVNRVEHVCRSRRLESALRGYREAFYPRPPSPSPALDQTHIRDLSPISDADADADERGQADISPFISHDAGERTTIPLFATVPRKDQDADTNVDLDEMMALEEMEREEHARSNVQDSTPSSIQRKMNPNPLDGPPVLEEEDEWEGLYD